MRNQKTSPGIVYPLDNPNLAWMRRGPNKRYVAVACRFPDCTKLIPRTHTTGRKWFCNDDHANQFRERRHALDEAIQALDRALGTATPNKDGEYTTAVQRHYDRDRKYLRKVRTAYQSPDSPMPSPRTPAT